MNRRNFIRILGGGAVLAAAGAGAYAWADRTQFTIPDSATAAWRTTGDASDLRRHVLSFAILAPNPHNRQPWMADLSKPGEISVSLDTARLLPATDPFGRQILMGLGAFLELLAMAAAQKGHRADIEVFPEGEPGRYLDGRRVARIALVPDPAMAPDPLSSQVLNRRTDRRPYNPNRQVIDAEIAALAKAAGARPVAFGVETAADRTARIRDIARRAWGIELATPETMMESVRLIRIGGPEIDRYRDGISISDPMLVTLSAAGLFDRTKPPAPGSPAMTTQIKDFDQITASTPAYLWIVTDGNRRDQQVEAGRAYVRATLAATGLGLSTHPNEQSLQEYPQVAREYKDIHGLLAPKAGQTVQMLARLGRLPAGTGAPGPAPRRGMSALITRT